MMSTTNEIIGFKAVRHLGMMRGITVRSRSVVGNLVGGLQFIFGGQIGAYVDLAESARQEAFVHMCEHAAQAGANAIIGMRYDANDIMDGITEVSPMVPPCGQNRLGRDRHDEVPKATVDVTANAINDCFLRG